MSFNPEDVFAYTPEKLQAMSYFGVTSLLKRAESRGSTRLCIMCREEISRRQPPPPKKHSPCIFSSDLSVSEFLKAVSERLIPFAMELDSTYDLSIPTAQQYSNGHSTRFRGHKLLSGTGELKNGGGKRDTSYSIDSYISWRIRDDIYSLTVLLAKNKPVTEAEYQIYAPQEVLGVAYKPISELRNKLDKNDELGLVKGGVALKNLNEAMDLFAEILFKVAPRK